MYDFDQFVDRRGTTSIKWNFQNSFGQQNGLLHPVFGYAAPLPSTFQAI